MSARRHVLLTGATGFVGQHFVRSLVAAGHTVHALVRDVERAGDRVAPGVLLHPFDLRAPDAFDPALARDADVVAHLAWPGLPRYDEPFHEQENLVASLAFLDAAVCRGARRVLVTGTCAEFGRREGACAPDDATAPQTSYARAKERLHAGLRERLAERGVSLQWVRLFYLFGPGQSPRTLLGQLDAAIDRGEAEFPMSRGEHARDYLPVEVVADGLTHFVERAQFRGPLHLSSGRAIRIRDLVERHIAARGATIRPCFGALPDPVGEPHAFWGVPSVVLPSDAGSPRGRP